MHKLREWIDAAIESANNDHLPGFLDDINLETFSEIYGAITQKLARAILAPSVERLTGQPMSDEIQNKLNLLAFALVRSQKRSSAFTGLVFAGFGRNDWFSSLHSVEIDGVYFNQLRILSEKNVVIDRRGETAAIVPFAQTDMPERFIFGIDQAFEEKLRRIAADLTVQILEQATDRFDEGTHQQIKDAAVNRFMKSIEGQKAIAEYELRSVANHLSKKELAEVAYLLVELTSRKRRYSSEMETVGGPIDVAMLTRNEGFVWVRRKQYFDIDLNRPYTERLKLEMKTAG